MKIYTFIDAVMYVSCTVAPVLLPAFDICMGCLKRGLNFEKVVFLNRKVVFEPGLYWNWDISKERVFSEQELFSKASEESSQIN